MKNILDFIASNELLAVDIETNGLNPRKDNIIGIGVSNAHMGHYVSSEPEMIAVCQALKSKHILMHNAAFDTRFILNHFGVDLLPNLLCDTMLLKHFMDENTPNGLKEVGAMLFGASAKDEQIAMKESIAANGGKAKEMWKADTAILAKYCIQDCKLTYRIYEHYDNLLSPSMDSFFYDDEIMPCLKLFTIPIMNKGFRLDVYKLKKAKEDISIDIKATEQTVLESLQHLGFMESFEHMYFDKHYPYKERGAIGKLVKLGHNLRDAQRIHHAAKSGKELFNISSKHNLKWLFFEHLKLQPLSFTDAGSPQVDNEFLASIVSEHPWVSDLVLFNKLSKLESTYIDNFIENEEYGRYYPRFDMHGTVSGRMSSDVQQLPRPLDGDGILAKYTNQIRQFIVADKDYTLVGTDYESLEPKVFCHVSGDPALQDIFLSGKDFYSEIALRVEKLEGVSSDKSAPNYLGKVNKAARQKAKAYSLGVPYGLTGYKLKFTLDIPQDEADKLVSEYLNSFPELKKWMETTKATAIKMGQIVSQSGRVRHLPAVRELVERWGVEIDDDLLLWKKYNTMPWLYEQAKIDRRKYKNEINNANNFQIQSLSASIVNRASIAIMKYINENNMLSYPILNIHDELVFCVYNSELEQVKHEIQKIMENIIKLSVPLVAIPSTGKNYAETK